MPTPNREIHQTACLRSVVLLSVLCFASWVCALPISAQILLFEEDFNEYSPGLQGRQCDTNLEVFGSGTVPGWTGSGVNHSHAVDLDMGLEADYALHLYTGSSTTAPNALQLNAGISANDAGESYTVSFDAAPSVWAQCSRATTANDALVIEILRADDSILADHTHHPGAWVGGVNGQDLTPAAGFTYVGDGSGDVRIRISSLQSGTNDFAGAIDNLQIYGPAGGGGGGSGPDPDPCSADDNPGEPDENGNGIVDSCESPDAPNQACVAGGRGCCQEEFDSSDLNPDWQNAQLGDGSSSLAADGHLLLTGTGSEAYHAADHGAFLHQTTSGDFRVELDIVDVPVDEGGQYRKGGLMVRTGLEPADARVMVQYVPHFPSAEAGEPDRPALQFDARGLDSVAYELASTVPGIKLPVRVAIQRRGDVFSVYYSTDKGESWIQPLGGAGGSTEIQAGEQMWVGPSVTSYDVSTPMTMAFDGFGLCRPSQLRPLPNPLPCDPSAGLDVVYVVDRSDSMARRIDGEMSKLDAALEGLLETNAGLALRDGPTRVAILSVQGTDDPGANLLSSAVVESEFGDPAEFEDLLRSSGLPVLDPYQPRTTSPAALGFEKLGDLFDGSGDPSHGRVVIWVSDGLANVDIFGEGPAAYAEPEVAGIGLKDGSGDFLPSGTVAWMGDYDTQIGTFAGQVLADTMDSIQTLRDEQGDVRIFSLVPRGSVDFPPVLPEGLQEYAAWYSQGQVFGGTDAATLQNEGRSMLTALNCGQPRGGRITGRLFEDLDGDGSADAGEPGLAGVPVSAGGVSTVSGANGAYVLDVAALDVATGPVTLSVDDSGLTDYVNTSGPAGPGTSAVLALTPWHVITGADFGFVGTSGPLEGCVTDSFDDGELDAAWDPVFLGDADQGYVEESDGTLKIDGDGTTAYSGTDNGVFVYRTLEGDFRAEVDVDGFTKDEGGAYRKGGLMVRSGLDPLDARIMVQVVPDFAGSGPALQFRARTSHGSTGDVALGSNLFGVGSPVRLAIERNGNTYTVQYSTDGGATWRTPSGGTQGSIHVDLGASPLVGMNVVSYHGSKTLTVELDNFSACAP